MAKLIFDIHCHPSFKAFGQSFNNGATQGNTTNAKKKNSVWYKSKLNRRRELFFGATPYTQSDFTSVSRGITKLIVASLYPFEKRFVVDKNGVNTTDLGMQNFIIGIGKERIRYLRNLDDYFFDLNQEYNYLCSIEKQPVTVDGKEYIYKVVGSAADIPDEDSIEKGNIIYVVITIEGAHSFGVSPNPESKPTTDTSTVLANIAAVKKWKQRPFFVTLSHHFYNELAGHARSLKIPKEILGIKLSGIDQEFGINTGITAFGFEVIDAMLDNKNNKRILVDIKHMSRLSRTMYFNYLDEHYNTDDSKIPIVVSHGGVAGIKSDGSETIAGAKKRFFNDDINIYDDELIYVCKSGGILGIQLDERRIASADVLHGFAIKYLDNDADEWSRLVWAQIQHAAEVLDNAGLPAWRTLCIGSDFDGIINPIGPFATCAEMPLLYDPLIKYATQFMKGNTLKKNFNKVSPRDIVDAFMYGNAFNFLKMHY